MEKLAPKQPGRIRRMIGVGMLTFLGSTSLDMAGTLPVSHPDPRSGTSISTPFDAHMVENVGPALDHLLQKLPSEGARETGTAAKVFAANMGRQYRDETVQPTGDAMVEFAEEKTGKEMNLPPEGRRLPFHLALAGVIGGLASLVGGRKKKKEKEGQTQPGEAEPKEKQPSKLKENLKAAGAKALDMGWTTLKTVAQAARHPVKASWGVVGVGTAAKFGIGFLPWQQVQNVAGTIIDPAVGLGFGVVLANQFIDKEKRKDILSEKNLPTTVGSAAAFAWGVFGGPYALAVFGVGWLSTKGYYVARNYLANSRPPQPPETQIN